METKGVMYLGRFLNCEVKNASGEELGKLEEVVADAGSGQLAYGVVSFHKGFMKGEKYFAVPWEALDLAQDDSTLLLDANKPMIENAAAFDKNNWPNMADKRWGASIHAFFQCAPYWERGGAGSYGRPGREEMQQPAYAGASTGRGGFESQPAGYGARGGRGEGRYQPPPEAGGQFERGSRQGGYEQRAHSQEPAEGSRENMEERERTDR